MNIKKEKEKLCMTKILMHFYELNAVPGLTSAETEDCKKNYFFAAKNGGHTPGGYTPGITVTFPGTYINWKIAFLKRAITGCIQHTKRFDKAASTTFYCSRTTTASNPCRKSLVDSLPY